VAHLAPIPLKDPHFKTWHGEHFSFHGKCDLVLVRNPQFIDGLGLLIYIQTNTEKTLYYVKNAAIKIVKDVVEIEDRGKVWDKKADAVHFLNGELAAALSFVSVSAKDSTNFSNNDGTMGHFSKPGLLTHNGISKFPDQNEFGQQWQVLHTEPMLFKERRAPQHPAQCLLPTVSTHRRLGEDAALHQIAQEAHAGVEESSKEFCIFDVTETGMAEAASTYFNAYVG
jgi:hypothetical protein